MRNSKYQLVLLCIILLLTFGSACTSTAVETVETTEPTEPVPISIPEGTNVLIVIRNYHSEDMQLVTDNELGVMIDMLDEAGLNYLITSLTFEPYESETRTVTPDFLVDSVDVAGFDAVILPCLAAGDSLASNPKEIVDLVKEFEKQEKVIAAVHGARWPLFAEKIITNEQFGRDVIQKGRIITSGCCPHGVSYFKCEDGTKPLIEKVIATLNECT